MAGKCVTAIDKITSIVANNSNQQFATKVWTTINKVMQKPDEIYDIIGDIDDGQNLLFCGYIIEIMGTLMQYSQSERTKILRQSKDKTDLFRFQKSENKPINGMISSQNVGSLQSKRLKATKFEKLAYKKQYSSVRIPTDVSSDISLKIREEIPHIYSHMIKSCDFHLNNTFTVSNDSRNYSIRIFNYGFHDKQNNNEELYCIAEPYTQSQYSWTMTAKPFTAKDIENKFHISAETLPKFHASDPRIQAKLQQQKVVVNSLQNVEVFETVINKTKWQKICVYNKRNNTNRKTLSFSKPEFVKQLKNTWNDSLKDGYIIPILMPNIPSADNGVNRHHIEFVQLLRIQSGCDIGLSYRYNETKNEVLACGIYLDAELIRSQHQLLFPNNKCLILDGFISNIDYLTIGNPDYFKNSMNRHKRKCETVVLLLIKLMQYFDRMMPNAVNTTDSDIKLWLDEALNTSKLLESNQIVANIKSYVKSLQGINNFYFKQTLSPLPQPIMRHPIHQYIQQPIVMSHIMTKCTDLSNI